MDKIGAIESTIRMFQSSNNANAKSIVEVLGGVPV